MVKGNMKSQPVTVDLADVETRLRVVLDVLELFTWVFRTVIGSPELCLEMGACRPKGRHAPSHV